MHELILPKEVTISELINNMITDDEKYSKVENEIIQFFLDNCELYFNRFSEDIEYLKICRNKCAHLKVNDNSLFVPKDYVARMLICSMFDNILSVKAPFIMDLFSVAKQDVESYSSRISNYRNDTLVDSISEEIKNKYLNRMTFDSIKKSYKTFIRLLWVSEKEESEKYAYGLYAFVYAITDYANVKGYSELFCDTSITGVFNRIETDTLSNSSLRTKALLKTIDKFHIVLDSIQSNKEVFDYLFKILIHKPDGIKYYDIFYPRNSKSAYLFFIENKSIQEPMYTEYFYSYLKNCPDFNMDNFMKVMVEQIPTYNGFNAADNYMSSLILHINELKIKTVEDILEIYKSNYQCTGRARHTRDMEEVDRYLSSQKDQSNNDETTIKKT